MTDENKTETNFIKPFIDSKNKGTPVNVEWSCLSWARSNGKDGKWLKLVNEDSG